MFIENDLAYLWKFPHGVYRMVKPSKTLEFRLHSTIRGPNVKLHSFKAIRDFESVEQADEFIRNGAVQ